MPSKPVRAVLHYEKGCGLSKLLESLDNDKLYIKPYKIYVKNNKIIAWIRVRGNKSSIKNMLKSINKVKGATYFTINGSINNMLIQISLPKSFCSHPDRCPLIVPREDMLVLSSIITKRGLLLLSMSTSKKSLYNIQKHGFRILDVLEGDEPNMLTEDQERILLYAYEKGYYDYPRRATLKDLSRGLGISVSTLAESLRKAERKLMDRIIHDDLILHKHKYVPNDQNNKKRD